MFVDLLVDGPRQTEVVDAGYTVDASFDAERVRESFTASLEDALRAAGN